MRGPKRNYVLTTEQQAMKADCIKAASGSREEYEAARAIFNTSILEAFGKQAEGETQVAYDDLIGQKIKR